MYQYNSLVFRYIPVHWQSCCVAFVFEMKSCKLLLASSDCELSLLCAIDTHHQDALFLEPFLFASEISHSVAVLPVIPPEPIPRCMGMAGVCNPDGFEA